MKQIIKVYNQHFNVDKKDKKISLNSIFMIDLSCILPKNDPIIEQILNIYSDIDIAEITTNVLIMKVSSSATCQSVDVFNEQFGKKLAFVKAVKKVNDRTTKILRFINQINNERAKKSKEAYDAINNNIKAQYNYLHKIYGK